MSVVAFDGVILPIPDESDDEDRRERTEFEIEKDVEAFVDEPAIRHNMYPDSESEEEEDHNARQNRNREHRDRMNRGDGNLYAGQLFFNGVAFKEAILDYALKTGYNLKQYRYDKTKIGYCCVGSGMGSRCGWRIYCSTSGKSVKWEVKVFRDSHSFVPNGHCEMIKVPVIARLFMDKIREEPEYYMPMKIEEMVRKRWKITVSRPQCQAARNKALKWIEKEYDEQFARIRDYGAKILESNPGSSVEIDTTRNEEGLDVFNRFYVCFEGLRSSWKSTCRPLIGVDGCFLRTKMKGQLLVALGRDAYNAIYPIAWGVVQVENTANWLWFVKRWLHLNIGSAKGLIRAVELELPKIEHRMCVRHIYGNLKAKHGKKAELKPLIWNLAWSYNNVEYRENLDRLFNYDSVVYDDVMKTNPRSWCRAFYKLGRYCEDVENNSTESFNSTLVKAREKPLVPMLETIARLAMVRICKRDVIAHAHQGTCTPYVIQFLAKEQDKAAECIVYRSTNNMYQVVFKGCSYRVCLDKMSCSCMKWDITGIPCEHSYGVMLNKKLEVEEYVCHWFWTSLWRRTYTTGITPLRGARFWPTGTSPSVLYPDEPPQPGRKKKSKKKKRKRGKNESPSKKKPKLFQRVMHCGICGTPNHNSRFHKKVPQGGSSQGEPSQGSLTQYLTLI